jgi:predicted  nucleic acid-binding Zn-ribbon protein
MADSDAQEDAAKVASHTLAFLRSLDRKMDLVLETKARHTERLGRLERDVAEVRRDLTEVRSDIALLENKTLSAQTEIVSILHRLEQPSALSTEHVEAAPPAPSGS